MQSKRKRDVFIMGSPSQPYTNRNRARRYVKHGHARWVDEAGRYCQHETQSIAFVPHVPQAKSVKASDAKYNASRLPMATMEDLANTPVVMAQKLFRIGNDRMPVRAPRLKPAQVHVP